MRRLGLVQELAWAAPLASTGRRANTSRAGAKTGAGGTATGPAGFNPVRAAAEEWPSELAKVAAQCGAEVVVEHGSLLVATCLQDLPAVLGWLAARPSVTWLSPRMASHIHNLYAASIIQGGGLPSSVGDPRSNPALRPIWRAGLDGSGQVIGCGDSGVDTDSCYFRDNAVDFRAGLRTDASGVQVFQSAEHRKIALYVGLQDLADGFGHGTHAAGTLLGSAYGTNPLVSPDVATGMAPGAKLAFMDLSRGRASAVWTPGNLARSYFPRTYAAGARVHSDSWGSDVAVYDGLAASVDRFAWDNPDFLPVFAAGNYGDTTDSSTSSTITSPAMAKNLISVGATLNHRDSWSAGSPYSAYTMTLTVPVVGAGVGKTFSRTMLVVAAAFGGDFGGLRGRTATSLAGASPKDACSGLNRETAAGKVVVAVRGNCAPGDKLRNAQAAGAVALLLTNNVADGYFVIGVTSPADSTGLSVPMGSVPLSLGRYLWDAVSDATIGGALVTFADRPAVRASFDELASFSSFGPTSDGRIKPDLVALLDLLVAVGLRQAIAATAAAVWSYVQAQSLQPVHLHREAVTRRCFAELRSWGGADRGSGLACLLAGVLTSAGTSGSIAPTGNPTCDRRVMQGTSMAAPVVAGAATLVRHYFAAGFYPTGAAVAGNAYPNPSGALVKGVLLTGGAPLQGNVEADNPSAGGLPLEPPPSSRQGWGRVDLTSALPLAGAAPNWRLQVVDGATLIQGQSHRYCVRATGGPLRVTLVWHDYPADPAAASSLVNDLNLEVRAAGMGGLPLLGNGWNDTANNVESVLLQNVDEGNVAIIVSGARVTAQASPQPYALVVLGKFSGVLQSPKNPVGGSDSTSGSCVITLAVIDDEQSTPPLTRSRDLSFWFTTQAGTRPAGGYECRIANAAGRTPPPLHDWRACTPPATYTGMADGVYTFQVRSQGEDVADTRTVTIDSTPPVTQFSSSLDLIRAPATATDNLTFAFSARDATPVLFECMLTVRDGGAPPYFRSTPQLPLFTSSDAATWSRCTSPLALAGLGYGTWSMMLRAVDSAGNVEVAGPSLSWGQRYEPGGMYTRLAASPPPLTNSRTLPFSLYSFVGQAAGAPTVNAPGSVAYEYRLWQLGAVPPTDWVPVTAIAGASDDTVTRVTVTAEQDGVFGFQARVAGLTSRVNDSVAAWQVTVDTTPTVVAITEKPARFQSSPQVTIRFTADPPDDSVVYSCRWLSSPLSPPSPNTPDSGATAYAPCAGPTPTSSTAKVANGYWLFQVKGVDAAGNQGSPTSVDFRTDLEPPVLTNVTAPPATQNSTVTIAFTVDDGSGSGVDSVNCTMTATFLVVNATQQPGSVPAAFQVPTGALQAPCPNPARYALQEGRYTFSLQAADRAGLRVQSDYTIVLDRTAPVTRVTTPPPPSTSALPSQVTIDFTSRDQPEGGASGVASHQCMVQSVSGPLAGVGGTTTASSSTQSGTTTSSVGGTGRRHVLAAAPRIANGSDIALGEWHACGVTSSAPSAVLAGASDYASDVSSGGGASGSGLSASIGASTAAAGGDGGVAAMMLANMYVTYQLLPSGFYSFQVRGVDEAGNVGTPSSPAFVFLVDASLPITTDQAGTPIIAAGDTKGSETNKLIIGIIAGVGGLLLVGVVLGVLVARRKMRQRALSGPAPAAGGIAMMPPGAGGPYVYGQSPVYGGAPPPVGSGNPDAFYQAAVQASIRDAEVQRQWEEERMRQAIQASIDEENLRKALEASKQDAASRSRGRSGTTNNAAEQDPQLQAAIRASLAMHGAMLNNGQGGQQGSEAPVTPSQVRFDGSRW